MCLFISLPSPHLSSPPYPISSLLPTCIFIFFPFVLCLLLLLFPLFLFFLFFSVLLFLLLISLLLLSFSFSSSYLYSYFFSFRSLPSPPSPLPSFLIFPFLLCSPFPLPPPGYVILCIFFTITTKVKNTEIRIIGKFWVAYNIVLNYFIFSIMVFGYILFTQSSYLCLQVAKINNFV